MTSHMRSVTPPPGGSVQLPSSTTSPSTTVAAVATAISPTKPKSLMETLLVAKMERVSLSSDTCGNSSVSGGPQGRTLLRTDSVDSTSSIGSITSTSSDVCRCDDCLLGIADLYAQDCEETKLKKKVNIDHSFLLIVLHQLNKLVKLIYGLIKIIPTGIN